MTYQAAEDRRRVWAWAAYDWANSAFATTVMAGFFPVFFKEYWAHGMAPTESTFQLGLANSVASLAIVLLAPILGTFSDRAGRKKRLLFLFAYTGALSAAGLYWVGKGHWELATLLYVVGVLGFSGSNVFYDALLINVARPERLERVSALGFAIGYLGGGLLFALNVYMVLNPTLFGLADASEAVRLSFLCVALWWAVFSVPLFLYVPDDRPGRGADGGLAGAFRELARTFSALRLYRPAFLFLLAYWLYIDGVDTIVRMAVDYGLALGFESSDLLTALLVTQLVGFPAALLFGFFGERWGAKRGIWLAISVYVLVVFWAWRMDSPWEFYALAVMIGSVQGGIQASSRALFAKLIPEERAGEFFGLYNMLGKFAAVIGPLLVGAVAVVSGSSRTGILSVLLLFMGGAIILRLVDEPSVGDMRSSSHSAN